MHVSTDLLYEGPPLQRGHGLIPQQSLQSELSVSWGATCAIQDLLEIVDSPIRSCASVVHLQIVGTQGHGNLLWCAATPIRAID